MSSKSKHDKKINVINRTTSETLRLGETTAELRVMNQTKQDPRKKFQNSSSSFQITGVSLTRIDIGDDSADDLDESHTDDISRVTDNETPSFSEDSRDTDDHQLYEGVCNSAATTLIALPVSDQSKSATIQRAAPKDNSSSNVKEDVVKMSSKPLPADKQQQQVEEDAAGARFKVVKLPSATPVKRGRWMCYDFMDTVAIPSASSCPHNPKYVQQHLENHLSLVSGANQPTQAYYVQGSSYQPRPTALSTEQVQMAYRLNSNQTFCTVSPHTSGPLVHHRLVGHVSQLSREFNDRDMAANVQSAININVPSLQQDNVKDDLTDIKVALTATPPTTSSGASPNNNNIDRKIEEALDAVKTHLMVAVHKEVDFLKTRVSTLEGRVNELEIENSLLRVNYLLFKS